MPAKVLKGANSLENFKDLKGFKDFKIPKYKDYEKNILFNNSCGSAYAHCLQR